MCSIFGVVLTRELSVTQRIRIQTLVDCMALAGATRGTDATGIGVVWPGMKHVIVKDAVSSYEMVAKSSWKDALYSHESTPLLVMGHTRAKTHGANTPDNAHPFAFEVDDKLKVMGTHNGVISNFTSFGTGKYDVDSASFLESIVPITDLKALGRQLYRISGSYALAFLHGDKFYLARNTSSPCVFSDLPGLQGYVYASTEHMLRVGATAAGLRLGKVKHARAGRLYGFNWMRNRWSTHIYETFNPATGNSVGYGNVKVPKEQKVLSTVTKVRDHYTEVETKYSDGSISTVRNYKCPACGISKSECGTVNTTCTGCLRLANKSESVVKSITSYLTDEVPLTAWDKLGSITEDRIEQLMALLKDGAHVPCTSCNRVFSEPFMQRSSMTNGVLCNNCESTRFATWWAEQCKERGTWCTVCKKKVERVMLRLKPTPHMKCTECDTGGIAP